MKLRIHLMLPCLVCIFIAYTGIRGTVLFFLAAAAHELGHILCMAAAGVPLRRTVLLPGGAVLYGDFSHCSYLREAAVYASGAAVNLFLYMMLSFCGFAQAAAVNLLLGCFNLLPLPGHDGERLLYALAGTLGYSVSAVRGISLLSKLIWAVFAVFAAWLFWFGALRDVRGDTILYGGMFWAAVQSMKQSQRHNMV